MPSYSFEVNGVRRTVEAAPGTPLVWILRDTLGLTGTKFGCGIGACGACTVRSGAEAVRSCQVTAQEAAGGSFTTLEGLDARGRHAVQRAWIAEDVAQCGYCQGGMMLTAAALLRRVPRPTDAQIDAALADLLCRCGTYTRIRRAVRLAAQLLAEEEAR